MYRSYRPAPMVGGYRTALIIGGILLALLLVGLWGWVIFSPQTRAAIVQWYPDAQGKFSGEVRADQVQTFIKNVGSVVPPSKRPPPFSPRISPVPLVDNNVDRLLLADYIARVYNGTSHRDILRLTIEQMEAIIMGSEWVYEVPNWPRAVAQYFAAKRRYVPGDTPDCSAIHSECSKTSGGACTLDGTNKCVASANSRWDPADWLATQTRYFGRSGISPIDTLTSNWSGERNEALLFQTQMSRGKYWGNQIFADPTRATLRRGMMNSPQQNPKFFDERFGYGAVPCNVLFEGGMLPIDSAFAQPGTIKGVLALPNWCNPKTNATCAVPPAGTKLKNKNVYSYLSPGSGMFFDSGLCIYMFNYVDGLLNSPPEFYDPTRRGFNYDYSSVVTTRLPNGLPDHVAGMSKLLIYLMLFIYWQPKNYQLGLQAEKTGDWGPVARTLFKTTPEQAKALWDAQRAHGHGYVDQLELQLPSSALPYLQRVEDRYHQGGRGLPGMADPLDQLPPPRGITSPRSLVAQVAALMGVFRSPNNAPHGASPGERYGCGLFTTSGQSVPAHTPILDRRTYAMGWINGRWYGYPPATKKNPFTKGAREGVRGLQVEPSETWTQDGYFMPTQQNPLVYYGFADPETGKREKLYETWYNKPIVMDYPTAAKLAGMMYSMGDTGWEESPVCWPFGSFFAYSEDLGAGKTIIGGMALEKFNARSLHYTMTPTSLSASQLVSPAYDYEILVTIPDLQVQTLECFCKDYMKSVNLFHDDGKYLADYAAPGKGALGGWYPPEAGVPFDGSRGMSNFTNVITGAEYNKDPVLNKAKGILPTSGGCLDSHGNVPHGKEDSCFFANFDSTKPNMVTGLSNVLEPLVVTNKK